MRKKILRLIIDKAKRSKLVQTVFEQPIDLSRLPIKGKFIDSSGFEHVIYDGLRTKIKPGWEKIFQKYLINHDKSKQKIEQIAEHGRIAVERMEPVINLFKGGIRNKKILEIGCHAGGASYALAEKGALEVTGTEFSGYKISSLNNKQIQTEDLIEVNNDLAAIRGQVKLKFKDSLKVIFLDDDICHTRLKPESFDLICSWDVLEHLNDPLNAFKSIRNLLTDGGVAVHEYNPFFSLTGGHSACTIDFPWGHVILNEADFKKYYQEYYPEYLDTAMSFYLKGINRMSMNDLKDLSARAGLEILSLFAFPREQDLRLMNKDILEMAKNNYPFLSLNDLVSPKIIIIQKRKI